MYSLFIQHTINGCIVLYSSFGQQKTTGLSAPVAKHTRSLYRKQLHSHREEEDDTCATIIRYAPHLWSSSYSILDTVCTQNANTTPAVEAKKILLDVIGYLLLTYFAFPQYHISHLFSIVESPAYSSAYFVMPVRCAACGCTANWHHSDNAKRRRRRGIRQKGKN